MRCQEFERIWIARGEGRFSSQQAAEFDEHLSACPHCARLADAMEGLEAFLDSVSDIPTEVPEYLTTRVMANLADVHPRRRWLPFRHLTSRRLLAVSMTCLAFFAGLLAREVHRLNDWFRTQGTIQEVVLQYPGADAQDVRLVGDFNGWGGLPEVVKARREGEHWVFQVRLAPGRYQYAFLVDGKRWLPDPGAAGIIPDGFGGENSVLYVQSRRRPEGRSL